FAERTRSHSSDVYFCSAAHIDAARLNRSFLSLRDTARWAVPPKDNRAQAGWPCRCATPRSGVPKPSDFRRRVFLFGHTHPTERVSTVLLVAGAERLVGRRSALVMEGGRFVAAAVVVGTKRALSFLKKFGMNGFDRSAHGEDRKEFSSRWNVFS
ncbi:MAG TPA: hypothetical protein VEK08_19840, partial [Planctomycetota bacterium]|nr:hypothetical protein [Planctomycetota bacterium]